MTTVIPSPTDSVLELGPFPLRMYALCILAGIVLAVWLTGRRLEPRGYERGQVLDVAVWAVLFGIAGGRLYHVLSSPGPYFGEGGRPLDAFKIWEGGLGIWGAISLGAVGAWIGCRRHGIRFLDFGDAAVPGIALAQAVGRWGNWFNNELYGRQTDLPWALEIHEWDQSAGRAVRNANGDAVVAGTYHPTFLYEFLFLLVLAAVLLVVDRRSRLAPGQLIGVYVAGYPVGRIVIETMRTDDATLVLGQRLNVWTSIVVFLFGLWIIWYCGRRAQRTPDDAATAPDDAPVDDDGRIPDDDDQILDDAAPATDDSRTSP